MSDKIFTLEEAEKLIPQLERIVENVIHNQNNAMDIGKELVEVQNQLRSGKASIGAIELANKQTELEFLVKVINEGLEAIEDLGCQPKDLDIGLIDFPSFLDGQEVLLCWKYGEKSIDFYHGLYEGFAGRKPLQRSYSS